jgi:hypothetical protein
VKITITTKVTKRTVAPEDPCAHLSLSFGGRPGLPGSDVIRPRQFVLWLLMAACLTLAAAVVVQALRTQQPLVAWLGAALLILMLPVIDRYRETLEIDKDGLAFRAFGVATRIAFADITGYGIWKARLSRSGTWRWLAIIGRDGSRIDVSVTLCPRQDTLHLLDVLRQRAPNAAQIVPDPRRGGGVRMALLVLLGAVLMAISALVLAVLLDQTLDAERLFSETAAMGIIGGLTLGAGAGRSILPKSPVAFLTGASLVLLLAVPAGALMFNLVAVRPHPHTERMTVLSRRSSVDRHGVTSYEVDVDIDGVHKRLSPSRKRWDYLQKQDSFEICVGDGALGFPVILSFRKACNGS